VAYGNTQFELARRLAAVSVLARAFMARGSRSENSVTEEVVQLLRELPGSIVSSDDLRAGESKHGADLEIWFRGGGFYFALHLQAKRLGSPGKTTMGRYAGLHKKQPNGQYQLDILRAAAKPPRHAGFIFYNDFRHEPTVRTGCCEGAGWAGRGRFALMLSDTASIEGIRPQTTVTAVLPLTIPLHCVAYCWLTPAFHPASSQRVPLPVGAARLPWRLAGGRPAMVARDPDAPGDTPPSQLEGLEVVSSNTVPNYVRTMAVEGTEVTPDEEEGAPPVVALIDEDAFADLSGQEY